MFIKLVLETDLDCLDLEFYKDCVPPEYVGVGVEAGEDGLNVTEFFDKLVKPVMEAYGYQMQDWYLEQECSTPAWKRD
jgi:hypothetical protein